MGRVWVWAYTVSGGRQRVAASQQPVLRAEPAQRGRFAERRRA